MMNPTIENHKGIIVIRIYDSISLHSIHSLEKIWDEQLRQKPQVLAIDFAKIDRIDSVGLSHLVKLSRNSIIKETELIFFNLNFSVLDLFKVARLDTFFNILSETEFTERYFV